jgi:hypothetical protein
MATKAKLVGLQELLDLRCVLCGVDIRTVVGWRVVLSKDGKVLEQTKACGACVYSVSHD